MSRIKLPKAVQEAADRADEFLKSQSEQSKPIEVEVKPVESSTETPPKSEVKVEPEVLAVVDKTKTPEYWEHRFKTLQGISEAEKGRLQSKLNELDGSVRELNKKLTDAAKSVPKEYDLRKYFSESEIEAYGEDMMKTMLRASAKLATETADERVNPEIAAQVKPLEEKIAQTEKDNLRAKTETFWDHFNKYIPNWEVINKDPEFHKWLAQPDAFTGNTRQILLTSAEQSLNSASVIAIFKSFQEEKAVAARSIQSKLETKVVPDSIPSSQIPIDEVPFISRSDINAFYKKLALAQRNRPANQPMTKDEMAMEAKIQAAYRTNRIT